MRYVLFADRGAMLMLTVQQLPALTHIDIRCNGLMYGLSEPLSDAYGLPQCKQLAKLHSQTLTELKVRMLDGPETGNTLQLSGLPQLRSCMLIGQGEMPLNVCITPMSFEGAEQLRSFHLHNDEGLQLQHGSLTQLAAVTNLAFVACGCGACPRTCHR